MTKRRAQFFVLITLLFLLSGGIFGCYPIVSVEFDTMGGSEIENQLLSKGSKATRPEQNPTKEGHIFIDWFATPDGEKIFNFNKKIKKDTTIYARWQINTYTINFVTEGTAVESITLPFNSPIELLESYRSGFVFNGWYLDSNKTNLFNQNTMPAMDLNLYAGWTVDKKYSAFEFEKNQTGYTLISVKDLKLSHLEVPSSYCNQPVNKIGKFAFSNIRQIPEITIPDSVIEVEQSAFEGCSSVERVNLPALQEFSDRMFYGCTNLKAVNFSDSLIKIGSSAFYGCSLLYYIKLPDSVETIGEKAFYGCPLTTIKIPEKVEILSTDIFYNCTNLTSVQLGSNIKIIGSGAFENCLSLKEIELVDSLESIGNRAFAGSGLEQITLPKNINSLGEYLFFNCRDLKSVTIMSQITRLESYTFLLCMALESIDLPSSLLYLSSGVFEDCHNLREINLPLGLKELGKFAFRNCVLLKEIELPSNVLEVPAHSFERCVSLQKVQLPNTLKNVNEFAFSYCYSLKDILLPTALESIGFRAFYDCKNIGNFDFGDALWQIGGQAFSGTSWLDGQSGDVYAGKVFYSFGGGQKVIFKEDTVAIAGSAFLGNKSLSEVEFCPTIRYIGDSAFEDCTQITQLQLPQDLEILGNNAFKNATALEFVEFNDSLRTIGNYAFFGCTNLKEIQISFASHIGIGAFSGCIMLEKIALPIDLTSISDDLFSGCTSLEEVNIPNSVKTIGRRAFYQNAALKSVSFSDNLSIVGSFAFEGCKRLTVVSLPDSVEIIMPFAFKDSGISKAFIGCGIKSIGEQAFVAANIKQDSSGQSGLPEFSDPRGLIVLLCGMPVVSVNSFPVGEQVKIIIYESQLFDAISLSKYENSALINWNVYKNFVYSSDIIEGDFLRQNNKLIAYLGSSPNITIPKWVREITPYAFFDLSFIEKVTFNDELTFIGKFAFYGTSITSFSIPQGVTAIGKKAFYVRTYIREISVTIKDASTHLAPALGEDAFRVKGYHLKVVGGKVYYKFQDDDTIYDYKIKKAEFTDDKHKNQVIAAFNELKDVPFRKNIIYIGDEKIYKSYLISWSQYKEYLYWQLI